MMFDYVPTPSITLPLIDTCFVKLQWNCFWWYSYVIIYSLCIQGMMIFECMVRLLGYYLSSINCLESLEEFDDISNNSLQVYLTNCRILNAAQVFLLKTFFILIHDSGELCCQGWFRASWELLIYYDWNVTHILQIIPAVIVIHLSDEKG